jgi:hypothetical protein
MSQLILNLEKRQAKVNQMLNCFKRNNNPEDASYKIGIQKFQKILLLITLTMKREWNKTYIR